MNNLQKLRKARGEKQDEIAALLGMSAANLSGYERGTRALTEEHINKLCDHFGVTADELLGRAAPEAAEGHYIDVLDSTEKIIVPDHIKADFAVVTCIAVPGLDLHPGDYCFAARTDRAELPADCFVLLSDGAQQLLYRYIRQPGIDLLYAGDEAVVWYLNGAQQTKLELLGQIVGVLKSL